MRRKPMVLLSIAVIVGMLIVSAWAWTQLPADAQIPIHWGVDGQANGFAPKSIGLFLLPATSVLLVIVLWGIPLVEPRKANLERSRRPYEALWVALIVFLGVIHVAAVAIALGAKLDIGRIVLIGLGALFVVIGNYLPKIRPNYLMGIRTPWTLTSDRSWVMTHRLGGRLFVLLGILYVVLGALGVAPLLLVGAIVVGLVVELTVVFIYSYRVWKTDPERRPS